MTKIASKIRFKAKLCRPAESAETPSWSFPVLPKNASAKLPSRGMTAIEGTLNGFPFQATLEPDGQKSHCITSARQPETRTRRIKNTCSMLAAGKRRVCCFDRSGFYGKSLSAPKEAI
jgi:hypothetical protein